VNVITQIIIATDKNGNCCDDATDYIEINEFTLAHRQITAMQQKAPYPSIETEANTIEVTVDTAFVTGTQPSLSV